jgi:hypothetical protein
MSGVQAIPAIGMTLPLLLFGTVQSGKIEGSQVPAVCHVQFSAQLAGLYVGPFENKLSDPSPTTPAEDEYGMMLASKSITACQPTYGALLDVATI